MRLEKGVLSHPVTGLVCAALCGVDVLLLARGSDLDLFAAGQVEQQHVHAAGTQQQALSLSLSLKVFQSNTVMGIKVVQPLRCNDAGAKAIIAGKTMVFLYGYKSLCVLEVGRCDGPAGGPTDDAGGFPLRVREPLLQWEHQLEDMVLDCSLLRCDDKSYIAVGYAHNCIDVYDLDALLTEGGVFHQRHRAYRVDPSEMCVLFSLSFSKEVYDLDCSTAESNWISVASGTAFGKIIVWRFDHRSHSVSQSLHSLTQHEGVIFNLRFDGSNTRLASVSDDRSVRVWSLLSGEQLFVGWGHGARVWDAVFLPDYSPSSNSCSSSSSCSQGACMDLIATCSEDGCIRVWDIPSQSCLCCLRGHSCDVWHIALSPEGGYLFAGGNDGSAKAFCVSQGLALCPLEPLFETIPFPSRSSGSGSIASSGGHLSRRADCVSFINMSACGSRAVAGLVDGRVWLVALAAPSVSSQAGSHTWTLLGQAPAAVVSGDSSFDRDACSAAVGLSDGRLMLLASVVPSGGSSSATASPTPMIWRAHALRVINTFLLPGRHVLSASTKGECALWQAARDGAEMPSLVVRCGTAKGVIATCAALLELHDGFCLLLGDSKGSITSLLIKVRLCSYCIVNDSSNPTSSGGSAGDSIDSSSFVRSSQYLKHFHAAEAVSVLQMLSARCFVSLGHDGSACVFLRGGAVDEPFALANRLSLLPIRSPDTILISPPSGEEGGGGLQSLQERSLYVGGYAGKHYIVYDVLRQLELLRVDGGSWKRPHACTLSAAAAGSPQAAFLCAAPCDASGGTVLLRSASAAAPTALPSLHFGYRSLGKVGYAVSLLRLCGTVCVALGGEEGRLKLLRIDGSLRPLSSSSQQPLFEASMPGNVCIRSICVCSGEGHTLVLAAGGRLTYALWGSYDGTAATTAAAAAVNSQFVCMGHGTAWEDASQDHRILAASLLPDALPETYIVVLCDSRGVVTLVSALISAAYSAPSSLLTKEAFTANASASPVLCCSVAKLHSKTGGAATVGCFGDTSGGVSVWLLRCGDSSAASQLLFSISSHCTGCNSLSLLVQPDDDGEKGSGTFIAVSGGDDQSICAVGGSIQVSAVSGSIAVVVRVAQRVNGCAGSAINGIKLLAPTGLQPDLLALSAGYDRRLAVWGLGGALRRAMSGDVLLSSSSGGEGSAGALEPEVVSLREGEGRPLIVRYAAGCVADLGDLGALDAIQSPSGAQVVVAGEGLQMFSLSF